MVPKKLIKRGAQHIASQIGPHRWNSRQPKLLILMYHRVLPDNHPSIPDVEPGMVVTPTTLELHINLVKQYFELISLAEWLKRKTAGKSLPHKACVITFDDGWHDNADYAFPILEKSQVPATIFLVAEWIGTNHEFWPERLAHILKLTASNHPEHFNDQHFDWLRDAHTDFRFESAPPTRDQLNQIYTHCKQWGDIQLHQRLDDLASWLSMPIHNIPSLLNWSQVHKMAESKLVEFGSHTCRHVRMNSNLDKRVMHSEIINSRNLIRDAIGSVPETFCYPNGDYTADAVKLVKEHYIGAVSTRSGWNSMHSDIWLLNRIGLHEDISSDRVSFLGRLSGWL